MTVVQTHFFSLPQTNLQKMNSPAKEESPTSTANGSTKRRPTSKRPGRGTNCKGSNNNNSNNNNNLELLEVYVGNLPGGVNDQTVCRFFNLYLCIEGEESSEKNNPITSAEVSPPNAWLQCASALDYVKLLGLNGNISYYSNPLTIEPSRRKKPSYNLKQTSNHSASEGSQRTDNDSRAAADILIVESLQTQLIEDKIMNYLLLKGSSSGKISCVPLGKHIKAAGLQDVLKNQHGGLWKFVKERPEKYQITSDPVRSNLFFVDLVGKPSNEKDESSGSSNNHNREVLMSEVSKVTEALKVATVTLTDKVNDMNALQKENQELRSELSITKKAFQEASAAVTECKLESLNDKICDFLNPGVPTFSVEIVNYLRKLGYLDFVNKQHGGLKRFLQQRCLYSTENDSDTSQKDDNDDSFWVTRFVSADERIYTEISQLLQKEETKRLGQSIIGNKVKSLGLTALVKDTGGLTRFLRQRPEHFQIHHPSEKDRTAFSVKLMKDYCATTANNNITHGDVSEKEKLDELTDKLENQASRCKDLEDTIHFLQVANQQYEEKEKHNLDELTRLTEILKHYAKAELEEHRSSFETEKEESTKTTKTDQEANDSEIESTLGPIKDLEQIVKTLELTQKTKKVEPPTSKLAKLMKELHDTTEKLKEEQSKAAQNIPKENIAKPIGLPWGENLPKIPNSAQKAVENLSPQALSELVTALQKEQAPVHFVHEEGVSEADDKNWSAWIDSLGGS